jgi:ATP-dependent HslUV protease subunit HslV
MAHYRQRDIQRTPKSVNFQEYEYGARRAKATTILGVRREGAVALAGDGQVTLGDVVLKHGARKIRTLRDGQVLAGFAGAVADALTLFEKFEAQLKDWDGNLRRASVELAKEWRTDRYLRRLEAQLIVADVDSLLVLSGEGDVIEPDDGIAAIGSGAPYATAAAKALMSFTDMDARDVVESAMRIAANLCIYTNDHFTIESVRRDSEGGLTGQAETIEGTQLLTPARPQVDDNDEDEDDDDDELERDSSVVDDVDEEVGG